MLEYNVLLRNICTLLDQRRRRWADVVQMLYKLGLLCAELPKPESYQLIIILYLSWWSGV